MPLDPPRVLISILGAAGRMGQRLIALAKSDPAFQIVGAIEHPNHPSLGHDAGELAGAGKIGVNLTADLPPATRLLIDFTTPESTRHWLNVCHQQQIKMLIGTTGLSSADHALIDAAATQIPILQSPTMALGVAVLYRLAAEAAKLLGQDYDIEIVECHHRFKKDAPSGTALGLADAILKVANQTRDALIFGRQGSDALRKKGEIAIHALRLGDDVGRHTAFFAAPGERLELTHTATNRDTFVHGALRAAKWLSQQPSGRYSLADVLGI